MEGPRKTTNTFVVIGDLKAEISTQDLPNMMQQC